MKGTAITLVAPSDYYFLKNVERSTKNEIKKYKVPSPERLKKVTITREMAAIDPLLASVKEKGDEYRMDDSYEFFTSHFEDFQREDILKIMFKWQFNEKMRRFNQLPDLDEAVYAARGSSRGDGRGNSRRRRGGHSADRSNDRRRRSSGGRGQGRRASSEGRDGSSSERRGRSSSSEGRGGRSSGERRGRSSSGEVRGGRSSSERRDRSSSGSRGRSGSERSGRSSQYSR